MCHELLGSTWLDVVQVSVESPSLVLPSASAGRDCFQILATIYNCFRFPNPLAAGSGKLSILSVVSPWRGWRSLTHLQLVEVVVPTMEGLASEDSRSEIRWLSRGSRSSGQP